MISPVACRRLAGALVASCILASLPSTADAAPVVAGFERFGKDDPAAARILFNELNCTACHAPAAKAELAKQAPVLDTVGTRLRTSYFKKFLADPAQAKPGATMPNVFAGDPEAAEKIEALAHFLASTGSPKNQFHDKKAVKNGMDLYHKVGCVACHGTRDAKGLADKTTPSNVPLPDLSAKYTIASLATFLTNPHVARPSGRMPGLLVAGDGKARAKEAADLANYLIQSGRAAIQPMGKGTTAYKYYEGAWQSLPNFAKMKAKATGVSPAFDLSVARRDNDAALVFDGVFRADADGAYTFHTTSDDGSKLYVDGKQVVDNDGIHAPASKSGTVMLTKGIHLITVAVFNGGGGFELDVDVEGPGLGRQPLNPLVAANEKDLDKIAPKPATDDPDYLDIKADLVAKGKKLFASAGCANCHQMKGIKSEMKAPSLADLKGAEGCLSTKANKGTPFFGLDERQVKALTPLVKTPPAVASEPVDVIHQTLLTFNCYACHGRNKIGGPEDDLNKLFQTLQPEMGDEARIPPMLDNVGGKMKPEYMKSILNNGSHDRPYMLTRMPAFGQANTGKLLEALSAVDKNKFALAEPMAVKETPAKLKGAGRHLVGAKAFSCYKCHTFAGQKAEGVQGIDMAIMTDRLQHDWFVNYLRDPQKIRPGTRMPSGFDGPDSLLKGVLGGKTDPQIEAIWVYLSDGKGANLPEGMKKDSIVLAPGKDAIVYRNFIAGAGPRAIGVGYPEHVNLAFDANELRLAMIWQGSFIDAGRHWTGRGQGFEPPLGDNILSLPAGPSFAFLPKADAEWPKAATKGSDMKFGGYQLSPDDRPTFLYTIGDVAIEDFPNGVVAGKETVLRRALTLTAKDGAKDNALYFRAAVGNKIEAMGNNVYKIDNGPRITLTSQSTPIIRESAGKKELLVPVAFTNNRARIIQEFAW